MIILKEGIPLLITDTQPTTNANPFDTFCKEIDELVKAKIAQKTQNWPKGHNSQKVRDAIYNPLIRESEYYRDTLIAAYEYEDNQTPDQIAKGIADDLIDHFHQACSQS